MSPLWTSSFSYFISCGELVSRIFISGLVLVVRVTSSESTLVFAFIKGNFGGFEAADLACSCFNSDCLKIRIYIYIFVHALFALLVPQTCFPEN